MQIPIVQLSQATLTMTQTLHPAVHQTYTTFSWMKALLMQKQRTDCPQMKKKLKHKHKHNKIQENTTNTTDNRLENRTNALIQGKETTKGNSSTQ